MFSRRVVAAAAVLALAAGACADTGEAHDRRARTTLHRAAVDSLERPFRFRSTIGGTLISGTYVPGDGVHLQVPGPAQPAEVPTPDAILSELAKVPYVTEAGGTYRTNLAAAPDGSIDVQAELSRGKVVRLRWARRTCAERAPTTTISSRSGATSTTTPACTTAGRVLARSDSQISY